MVKQLHSRPGLHTYLPSVLKVLGSRGFEYKVWLET